MKVFVSTGQAANSGQPFKGRGASDRNGSSEFLAFAGVLNANLAPESVLA